MVSLEPSSNLINFPTWSHDIALISFQTSSLAVSLKFLLPSSSFFEYIYIYPPARAFIEHKICCNTSPFILLVQSQQSCCQCDWNCILGILRVLGNVDTLFPMCLHNLFCILREIFPKGFYQIEKWIIGPGFHFGKVGEFY